MKITFVLDNIRSAFNVGSIFRTADGLDFEVHLIGITPIPGIDKKLDKTSLSSLDSVKWEHIDTAESWFKVLNAKPKEETNLIISLEETKDYKTTSLFDLKNIDLSNFTNIFIVLGHEINGVNKFLLDKSDHILQIPMFGKKNSLNVATCAGIVGYRIKELIA